MPVIMLMEFIVRDRTVWWKLSRRAWVIAVSLIRGLWEVRPYSRTKAYTGDLELVEFAIIVAPCGKPKTRPAPSRLVLRFDLLEELDISIYTPTVQLDELAETSLDTKMDAEYCLELLLIGSRRLQARRNTRCRTAC